MSNILITGASGSVGSHLLERLNLRGYAKVYCLTRGEARSLAGRSRRANISPLRGDLLDLERLAPDLHDLDTVIHLAAVTGKAHPKDYFRVNVEGTRAVVEFCRKKGVQRLLHLSSIAVQFPEEERYYYARSKQKSEDIVRASGLRYAILRPTIILGPGSSTWDAMSRLAELPLLTIFGDGKTLIQPIWVDDLVDFIETILDKDLFDGQVFDVGGPDILCIEQFLKRIQIRRGRRAPAVHLPVRFVVPLLSAIEKLLYSLLPLTVGQLSSFRWNGTVTPNRLYEERKPRLKSVDDMLAMLESPQAVACTQLKKECYGLTYYLIGAKPDAYVVRKYADAHAKVASYSPNGRFDRWLVRFARSGRVSTKIADCYARFFAPESALRRKMILLTAILESTSPFYRSFALQYPISISAAASRSVLQAFSFLLGLITAVILLGPVRLFLGLSPEGTSKDP